MNKIAASIMIDEDLLRLARKRCVDYDLDLSQYIESLIGAEVGHLVSDKAPTKDDFFLLAVAYGHLVRTFGPKLVRRAHHRYLVRKVVPADDQSGQKSVRSATFP